MADANPSRKPPDRPPEAGAGLALPRAPGGARILITARQGGQGGAPGFETWRIVLDQRALPLPVLRPITIGSDARNGIQLAHGSVKPFHARLKKRGAGIHIKVLDPAAALIVGGASVQEALLKGGEEVCVGDLRMRIDKGAIAPAVRSRPDAAPSLEQEFQRLFLRELRRAPSFVISVLAHALLIWSLQTGLEGPPPDDEVRIIVATLDERGDAMPAEEPEEPEESPPEVLETEEELPEIDLFELEEEEPEVVGEDPLSVDLASGAARIGVGGTGLRGGFGGRGIRLDGVAGPLGERLRRFREHGLDVVFLIDTTASMELFLSAAKQTVDRMITDLAALIPNLRLGIVAYRDRRDEYVTHAAPLSTDRYGILNFLEGLQAKGGDDVPEAVLDAVEFALDQLEWQKDAHKVLLIVADAPPHADDMAKLRTRIRSAVRSTRSSVVVSTIFTGAGELSRARQVEAVEALQEIAEAGGGEFSHLEDPARVLTQLVSMALASQERASVEETLRRRKESPRVALVQRKVEERDVEWLIGKLSSVPVEPAVVEGLVRIASPAVARRCLDVVAEADAAKPAREAALYVLRRITRFGGSLDFNRSLAAQEQELMELQAALERTYRRERR